jgi:hypothetical protein
VVTRCCCFCRAAVKVQSRKATSFWQPARAPPGVAQAWQSGKDDGEVMAEGPPPPSPASSSHCCLITAARFSLMPGTLHSCLMASALFSICTTSGPSVSTMALAVLGPTPLRMPRRYWVTSAEVVGVTAS